MGDNMNEILIYGISALLCCFAITTFILSRIPANVSPDSYFFKLDPFWAIVGTMFVGGLVVYHFFPEYNDMLKKYSYFDFSVPIIFAVIIYLSANLYYKDTKLSLINNLDIVNVWINLEQRITQCLGTLYRAIYEQCQDVGGKRSYIVYQTLTIHLSRQHTHKLW